MRQKSGLGTPRPPLYGARMIRIRPSIPTDGDRAVEIWRDAVDATHDFLTPEDRIAIEEEVKGFLPEAPLWLAVDSADRPVAFMLLDDNNMEALFIDPAYRGQGVGKALVEHAIALHSSITTEVNEQNGQAVGFYQRMGFVPTGRSERDGQGRPYPLIHLRFTPQN
jgi:putative acetyltransferase